MKENYKEMYDHFDAIEQEAAKIGIFCEVCDCELSEDADMAVNKHGEIVGHLDCHHND